MSFRDFSDRPSEDDPFGPPTSGKHDEGRPRTGQRQRVFNAPPIVIGLILVLVGVHLLQSLLPPEQRDMLFQSFGFVPGRFLGDDDPRYVYWLDGWGRWLTFFTHTFLHADFVHLAFNTLWLLVFATPVVQRIGAARFLGFYAVCGVIGVVAHMMTDPGGRIAVIGASGAISGLMGGATRFIFSTFRGARLGYTAYRSPLSPLTDRRVVLFAIVFTLLNVVFGMTDGLFLDAGQSLAWVVHLGGFFAGLVLMPLFDRPRQTG